jgi:ABC-type branched-subunit amino acid transport system ATPase component
MNALLSVESVHKYFGGLKALRDVSVDIKERTVTGIIGPNGSGKTTLVNVITGFLKPDKGKVMFDGKDITGWSPDRIYQLGIARTFQAVRVFNNLTLSQNIQIAKLASGKLVSKDTEEYLFKRLDLSSFQNTCVKNLSLFDQRKLEVAMKLVSKPKLLILDEPTAGMNPMEVSFFLDFINELRKEIAIVIIEHSIKVITTISDNVVVLNEGVKIAEGHPSNVINNKAVIEAYIGGRLK